MESSLRFFRFRGIPIGAHWSWLFVVALVVWSLAGTTFPSDYPGLSGTTYLAMAVVTAVLFFASILLHELGHTVRALREGMGIRSITLWLFGGVARMEGAFPSAGAELRVAIAGPAVSGVLGAAFGLGALAAGALDLPEAARGVLVYLATINLLLLGFNLMPALPLDGGRVVHAWLWRRQRSATAATRSAALAGEIFGVALAGIGLLGVLTGTDPGGLWLLFLGWFIHSAARSEAADARMRVALGGLRVRDVMTPDPVTVPADVPAEHLLAPPYHRHSTYPVEDGGRLVGLVSLRDVLRADRDGGGGRRVRDLMRRRDDVPTVAAGQRLLDVLDVLAVAPGRAVVVDDADPSAAVGMLAPADVIGAAQLGARRAPERPVRGPGVLVWLVVALGIVASAGMLYHPPYVVIAPGPAIDVSGDVTVRGVATQPPTGQYLLTTVQLSQPSLFGTLIAALRPDRDVVRLSEAVPGGIDDDVYDRWQRQLFADSRLLAAAAAARANDLPATVTGGGAEIVGVSRSAPARKALETGDVVVAVDGQDVHTTEDLRRLVQAKPVGTTLRLTVERDGDRVSEAVASVTVDAVSGTTGLGVYATTHDLAVELPFDVEFRDRPDIGGPSGGLVYALTIADMLDPTDYARSRVIAATGTIDQHGGIGLVGAVEEKAVAASDAGAAVLVVPTDEVADVGQPGLDVQGATTLDEALAALRAAA